MGINLTKIIGGALVIGGTMLAVNAYPALFSRINEIRDEVRTNNNYQPRIELRDCFIGETGLTYGVIGALTGAYLLSSRKKAK